MALGPRVAQGTAPAAALTECEYLRALRVVAGQVTLPGEADARALQDVWMDVEIARLGQQAQAEARSGQHHQDGDGHRAEGAEDQDDDLEARAAASRGIPSSVLSAEGVLSLAERVFIWGDPGTGKSTLLSWLACKAAQNRKADDKNLVPVWIRFLPPAHRSVLSDTRRSPGSAAPVGPVHWDRAPQVRAPDVRRVLRREIRDRSCCSAPDGKAAWWRRAKSAWSSCRWRTLCRACRR